MGKRFGSTIRIVTALFLALFMTNFMPVMTAHAADAGIIPLAPSQTDLCGTDNDIYTIPTTAGVIYSVNGIDKNTSWYETHGASSITIEARGKTVNHILTGQTSWTFTYDTTPCAVNVTPAAPTQVEACGTNNDSYFIPASPGVIYKANDVSTPAGTHAGSGDVTVTAHPLAAQYVLNGQTSWTFHFDTNPCATTTVTPEAPTFAEACGTAGDTYTIPATQGVIYKVNGTVVVAGNYPACGTVTVTAEAETNYTLTGGTYSWESTFTNSPCPVTVTPKTPKHIDLCGTDHDFYIIPSKTGVLYQINGQTVNAGWYPGNDEATITAIPTAGHVTLSGDTSWTFEFDDTDCVVVDVDSTDSCIESDSTDGFVTVDVTNNYLTHKLFRVTVDGDEQFKFVAPGETHTFTFDDLGPGKYRITAEQLVAGGFSLAPVASHLNLLRTTQSTHHWDTVYKDRIKIDECPCEEPEPPVEEDDCPVIPPTDGNILGEDDDEEEVEEEELPEILPATGASSSAAVWIPLAGAIATYLVAYKINNRKKYEA